jgi:uncharacterized protein YgbK (DUF1537 family)
MDCRNEVISGRVEPLEVGIIADDWTGACDSGVQLVKAGLRVYAVSGHGSTGPPDAEALVYDTDSRALPRETAYERVRHASAALAENEVRLIYKKMDSTLRGNIGAELDAVCDALAPDIVVIAPAFPAMGRRLIDGNMYVNGQLLHETPVSADPRTPVTESNVPRLLARQTTRAIGHVAIAELMGEPEAVLARLAEMREQGIIYIVFDAESDEQLRRVVSLVRMCGLKAVWAGSAGLASCLPIVARGSVGQSLPSISPRKPALVAIGSVHDRSRRQLQVLLQEQGVAGVSVAPEMALDAAARKQEIARVVELCREAAAAGWRAVLYTQAEAADIERAFTYGERSGRDRDETSRLIAEMLGEAAAQVIRLCGIERVVLTGGDTAKQVCSKLGAPYSRLLGEMETGIPISRLGETYVYAVTKAGGFGSDDVFVKACRYLEGGSS